MAAPGVKIRGIRSPAPSGNVLGRLTPGTGDVELIDIRTLASQIVGTGIVSGGGAVVLPNIASGDVLGNATAGSAPASDTTLTALIDRALGSTQGSILYRNATAWVVLLPGLIDQLLLTQGTAANPIWKTGAPRGMLPLVTGDITPGLGPFAIVDDVGQFIGIPI